MALPFPNPKTEGANARHRALELGRQRQFASQLIAQIDDVIHKIVTRESNDKIHDGAYSVSHAGEVQIKIWNCTDKKESERVLIKRVEFWQMLKGILAKNLIFIDESGVNLALTRLNARSIKGRRAHEKRPYKRGKNVSIIGAIGLKRVIASANILDSVNGLRFEAFIAQKLTPKLWKEACVIMDNCSIHLGKEIEKLINKTGARIIFPPPYSPDFSSIENFWSKIKSILHSLKARTYPDLEKALEEAFEQISLEDIKNWFTHGCYCTSLDWERI